jgi:hypothetical protein
MMTRAITRYANATSSRILPVEEHTARSLLCVAMMRERPATKRPGQNAIAGALRLRRGKGNAHLRRLSDHATFAAVRLSIEFRFSAAFFLVREMAHLLEMA